MSELPGELADALRERQKKKAQTARGAVRNKMARSVTDLEFVACLYRHGGSSYKVSEELGIPTQNIQQRRASIEHDLGVELPRGRVETWKAQAHRTVLNLSMEDGTILIGSDLHAWPDIHSAAMAAFVDFNRRLKPQVVILNGDGLDGAQISRHPRLGWDKRPSPAEEIQALSEYSTTLLRANPNARYIRTRGNHDSRLETYLSTNAPLVEGLKGTSLADHLPGWEEVMAIWVNGRECFIKHRGKHSGIHATFNEVRRIGTNFVHGHLHAQHVIPYRNAHGDLYGVDLGMLAPVSGPQFDYTELDVTNWRSGFAVLSFRGGKLLPPQLVTVIDEEGGQVSFAGQVLTYSL